MMRYVLGLMKAAITFLFLLAGLMKLTAKIDFNQHIQLTTKFRNEMTPLWQNLLFQKLDFEMDSEVFQRLIGVTEVLCAILIWTSLRRISAFVLMCVTAAAVLTHVMLDEEYSLPAVFCVFNLVVCVCDVQKKVKVPLKPLTLKKQSLNSESRKESGKKD